MEVIGGTAAVSQLLGQAITIVQKIQDARARVSGASDRLDGHLGQLDNLLSALRLVQDESELQTPPVEEQVQKIISLGKELQRQLDPLAAQLAKSKAKQYTHAFISGDKDEKELENAMTQLDRAKADLNALIVTTRVGLSGSIRDGFTASLAVVQRVDRNVQRVLGERVSMAAYLEERGSNEEGNGTVLLTADDVKALNLVDKVSWIDDEAFDDANIFNSDLVERQTHDFTERTYQGNKAHKRSTLVQGRADAAGIVEMLQASSARDAPMPHPGRDSTTYSGNRVDVDSTNIYGNVHGDVHLPGRSSGPGEPISNRCLRDLRVTDPREDLARIVGDKDRLLRGCYAWILDDASFQRWRTQDASRLLWIKGDPGKGKTMMTMGVIDELYQESADRVLTKTVLKATLKTLGTSRLDSGPSLLAYFFCQSTQPELNNAVSVLRGLIYLLIAQRGDLIQYMQKRYESLGKLLFEGPNAVYALREILLDMLNDPSLPPTYLLIDALDECTSGLSELLRIITDARLRQASRVKWLVTSRNIPEIERYLQPDSLGVKVSLEVNASHVSRAVAAFVAYKVQRLATGQRYDPRLQAEVQQELGNKAEGTFLWVSLVCKELEKVPLYRTREVLQALPPGLHPLYDRMMAIITAQDARTVEYCRAVLRSITLAYRPLQCQELAMAASLPRDQFGDLQAVLDLISRCGSFLTIREGVVSFIHSSAKDYFTVDNGRRAGLLTGLDPLNDQVAMPVHNSSVGSRRSQDLPSIFDSSSHAREGDSSTLPTSSGTTQLEVQTDKQTRDVEYEDARTTYSVDLAPDDLEKDYIRAFARRLLQDVENASGVTNISKIPSSHISDTLRAFNWRLHHESSNPFQWGTSVTLHRKRAHIIAALTSQETSEFRPEQDNESFSGDDEREGEEADRKPFVKTQAMYHEWLDGVSNSANDANEAEETLQYQRADEEYLPQLPDYEAFIRGSEAYRWLVTKICQHERLAFAKNDTMSKIGSTVLNELRTQEPLRKMSRRAPLSTVEIQFKLDWHPGLVLEEQKLTNTPSNVLDIILCITGSFCEAQALTVSEYVRQTWPVTGEAVLNLFTQLLCLPQGHQDTHYMQKTNGLRLTAHLDIPHSCVVSVVADIYRVSEVAEQIAWLAATLQPSSRNRIITARFPHLQRASAASTPAGTSTTKVAAVYVIRFESDDKTELHESNGLCWSSLFPNVNIVSGYPILRRPQPNTGLEISLGTLAYLVRSDQIVQCGRRIMMKGFNSLVIATFVTSSVVLWHLLVSSEPSERISYFDNRQDALKVIESGGSSLRILENARHIVGWCPNVEELCGHKTANRMISTSELTNVPSSIVIDRIYLEGGMYAIAGMNMRFNQKEDPIRLLEDRDYPSLLKWIAAQPIVFFDTNSLDRRAWLIDGASALLHLVRVSLHRDEMDDESTFEWVFDASALKDDWPGCTGRQAAIKTLKSFDNLNLKVYVEKRVGSVAQFSTLRERVMNVLHAMEILIDTQQREAAKGEIRTLQTLDRRKFITGFDILDVIEPFGSINTRIARFDSWGDGWIDILPSIGATTFFGQGFGDLVLPTDLHSVCTHWKTVPTRNDYLCASVSTLKMLHEKRLRRLGSTLGVGKLTDKILWTSPSRPFDNCSCLRSPTSSDRKHCDPVQFLVTSPKAWRSKLTLKDSAPIDLTTLDDTGAVVFANLGLLGRRVSVRAEASIVEGAASISAGSSVSQLMSVASTSATASKITPPTDTTNTTDTNNTIQNTISSAGRDSMEEAARIVPKQKAKGRMDKLLGIFKRGWPIRERRS